MSAPVLDDIGHDMPLERVAPVRRDIPPLRRRRQRPPLLLAVLAVLAASLTGAVAAFGPTVPLTWTVAGGQVSSLDGPLLDGDVAPIGTELEAGPDGAILTATGARVELAPGTVVELQDAVGPVAQTIVLRRGAVVADVDVTLVVDATVAQVNGFGGAFRVERDETPRIATYDAAVGIIGDTGVSMTLLTQMPLDGGQQDVGPILLDPDDAWDRRYAEVPLATDAQLAALAAGLEARYGTAPQTAAFYTDFVGVTEGLVEALPGLAAVEDGELFGPPAETLVAAVAITAVLEHTGRSLDTVIEEIARERAAGGTWGVLLAQDGLDAEFVGSITDAALTRREQQGEDAAPVNVTPPAPTQQPPTSAPSPTPGPEPSPTSPPSDAPSEPPPPEPTPEPVPDPTLDPGGTIDDLLDPEDPITPEGGVGGQLEDLLDDTRRSIGGLVSAP